MLKPMLYAEGAELHGSSQAYRLCRPYRAATQEMIIGFSESELARENGAAGLAKTELRRLGANK